MKQNLIRWNRNTDDIAIGFFLHDLIEKGHTINCVVPLQYELVNSIKQNVSEVLIITTK